VSDEAAARCVSKALGRAIRGERAAFREPLLRSRPLSAKSSRHWASRYLAGPARGGGDDAERARRRSQTTCENARSRKVDATPPPGADRQGASTA
jgi:hypothetical protein